MKKLSVRPLLVGLLAILFVAALFGRAHRHLQAQSAPIDVVLELAGPWSYAPDPWHKGRIIVAVPYAGHILKVFTGDDPLQAVGATGPMPANATVHQLNFAAVGGCGSNSSTARLYPPSGVTGVNVKAKLTTSFFGYAISLPKPCYFEEKLSSRMKYGTVALGTTSAESTFTTVMILHYKAATTTTAASFESGSGLPSVAFSSNGATHGISIAVYLPDTVPADVQCDSHSGHAFYQTEVLWGLTKVYRLFPMLQVSGGSNTQLPSYAPADACIQHKDQDPMTNSNATAMPEEEKSVSQKAMADKHEAHTNAIAAGPHPGRADCHSPQGNINGAVQ